MKKFPRKIAAAAALARLLQQHRFRFRLRFFRRKFRDSSQSRLYSGAVII